MKSKFQKTAIRAPGIYAVPLIALGILLLASCASEIVPTDPTPAFHKNLESISAVLDVENAAAVISNYRKSKGLNALVVDQELVFLAQQHSNAQARLNKLGHNADQSFQSRLKGLQRPRFVAVENVGAGYRTMAQAFSGWRNSKGHDSNMLNPKVTRMGIAKSVNQNSKYRVFWTLILTDEPI